FLHPIRSGGMCDSTGIHPIYKTTSGGVATLTTQVSGMFDSNAPPLASGQGGNEVGGTISGSFLVTIDPRAVGLTRQGAHNETVDSSGTIHGDTLFNMTETSSSWDPFSGT